MPVSSTQNSGPQIGEASGVAQLLVNNKEGTMLSQLQLQQQYNQQIYQPQPSRGRGERGGTFKHTQGGDMIGITDTLHGMAPSNTVQNSIQNTLPNTVQNIHSSKVGKVRPQQQQRVTPQPETPGKAPTTSKAKTLGQLSGLVRIVSDEGKVINPGPTYLYYQQQIQLQHMEQQRKQQEQQGILQQQQQQQQGVSGSTGASSSTDLLQQAMCEIGMDDELLGGEDSNQATETITQVSQLVNPFDVCIHFFNFYIMLVILFIFSMYLILVQ